MENYLLLFINNNDYSWNESIKNREEMLEPRNEKIRVINAIIFTKYYKDEK
jgi:hypothetical protein